MRDFPHKFGVALDDRTHDRVIAPLGHDDSKSERIRELVKDGLAIEESLDRVEEEYGVALEGHGKRGFVRQAIADHAEREFGGDGGDE